MLALAGCQGEVEVFDGDGASSEPVACAGALGAEPRVLSGGLGDGMLLLAGEQLVHVEHGGTVRRIDRCTGETAIIAAVSYAASAAIRGGFVFVAEPSESPYFGYLMRVPIAGGDTDFVAELPAAARLIAHDQGLFAKGAIEESDHEVGIFEVDSEAGLVVLRHQLDSWQGVKQLSLIGASHRGLYYNESYDCACSPELQLWPFDDSKIRTVTGTPGARSTAVVGDDLFVAAQREVGGWGEMTVDIVRLPLEGGEPEVIVPASDEHTYDVRRVAANETTICWTTHGAPPRCIDRAGQGDIRLLDRAEEGHAATSLILAEDAAYWIREETDGPDFELVGAAVGDPD